MKVKPNQLQKLCEIVSDKDYFELWHLVDINWDNIYVSKKSLLENISSHGNNLNQKSSRLGMLENQMLL